MSRRSTSHLFVVSLIVTIELTMAGCARYSVYRGFQAKKNGIVYRLPQTVLLVNVPVARTTWEVTPLTPYAATTIPPFEGLPEVPTPGLPEETREAIEAAWKFALQGGSVPNTDGRGNPAAPATDPASRSEQVFRSIDASAKQNFATDGMKPVARNGRKFEFGQVTITSAAEPDPAEVLFVELSGDATQDRLLRLNLNRVGMLTDAESSVKDRKLELALATIGAAARVAASAVPMFAGPMEAPGGARITLTPDAARAYSLRQQLKEVRASRLALLTGPAAAGATVEVLKERLRVLDQIEEGICAAFFSERTVILPLIFEVRPPFSSGRMLGDDAWNEVVLVRLAATQGVSVSDAFQPSPPNGLPDPGNSRNVAAAISAPAVWEGFAADENADFRQAIALSLAPNRSYAISNGTSATGECPTGFVYRIPGAVDARVAELSEGLVAGRSAAGTRKLKKLHVSQTVQVAQAGITVALPRDFGSSPEQLVSIALYEDTGGLKSFKGESKSIDPELIRKFGVELSESVDKAAKAIQAAREAEAKEPSRLERMTQRVDQITKLMKALKDAGIEPPQLPDLNELLNLGKGGEGEGASGS